MIDKIKHHLKGLTYATSMNNRQGCGVSLKNEHQRDLFDGRIEYYFGAFSRASCGTYNILATDKPSVSDLEVFDFFMPRFILSDMFGLLLEYIDLREQNHLTEFVVVLSERELMDDAGDNGHDTELEHWAWDYLQETFAGLYEKGLELEPQQVYMIEDGKLHVHFKIEEV
jgi:hypothetical protein